MGLIIKDRIPMMIVGFPTISDKYNVAGATLTGSTPAKFGDLVVHSSTAGYFEVPTSTISAVTDIAGFVLGTNVKLNEQWPEGQVQTNPGEAFNITLPGTYMAVELDAGANTGDILPGATVAVILNTANKYGKLTTSGASGATDFPAVVFTGTYENHGTDDAPKIVAEIYIK